MANPNNQQNVLGHKKQVRRRLHTSRPYQERLLNMAEARKEIVTALKFHRASMKQANEKKQQLVDFHQTQNQSFFDCEIRTPKNETSYSPSTYTPTNVMVQNFPYYQKSFDNNNCYPIYHENSLNIPLPNQTLGLNLNLQAFANLDTSFCHSINTTPPANFKYLPSSSMSPSSSCSSTPRDHLAGVAAAGSVRPTGESMNVMMEMHPALDEAEMAEIRSMGERHEIEWDDTVNLVKSARWFKFLKSVEFGKEIKGEEEGDYNDHNYNNNNNNGDECPFGEVMEFPAWLSTADQSFLQQHLEDSSTEDTTLPWMDIGDIDAIDDDWFS